ncbi:TIGR02444 family protein [Rhizobium sp. P32RR-XVIII]|uniref:TIGR02444 family protein n=1 Tax=Rhizobium sp. P32RR-XVIII TaxID=2726738 RepID=UPI001456E105|nr:TIGR02444 family protein [Rhizobium sp. P32RR-XVIII]NLS03959.1 TIGR02444 family protein [Rhizobium sp. P32RR-XVIII]
MNTAREQALWDFAVSLYGRPGVAEACLALQDEDGVDVPLLLYAAWLGDRGIALSASDIAEIIGAIGGWQREIVSSLRVIRKRLKEGPSPAPNETTDALRNAIKSAELSAERIELALLESQGRHLAATGGGTAAANMIAIVAHHGDGVIGERASARVWRIAAAVGP